MKSSKPEFDKKALSILKTLEHLRNHGQYNEYNKQLSKLARRYPEIREMVKDMKIDRKSERALRSQNETRTVR